jgi:hypothetical protein
MLVFYSPESLERLASAQTFFIFMDGTFSVPPHPFKQLYTIRVPFNDVTGTAVYAFLPNKCQGIAGTVGCCCVLLRQSDICTGGWDWGAGRWYRIVRLGFSSRGSKAWTLSSHWDTMKIQFLGNHTITLPVIHASSTQKPEMP